MKKQLTVLAAAVAVSVVALPAAPASASSVCAPITVDGQPIVCVDPQPVYDAIGLVVGAATNEASVAGCPRLDTSANATVVYLPLLASQQYGVQYCFGYKVTLVPQTSSELVHVPRLCLTTTGTCVGPIDEGVPLPVAGQSPLTTCVEYRYWYRPSSGNGDWTDDQWAGLPSPGCVSVPAIP